MKPPSPLRKLGAFDDLSLMFESVEGGESLGRYSFIGIDPDRVWHHAGDKTRIGDRDAAGEVTWTDEPIERSTMDSLRAFSDAARADIPAPLPPMSGGRVRLFRLRNGAVLRALCPRQPP